MGKVLGLLLWIITIGTVILFAGKWWWFPAGISNYAAEIDAQFNRTLIVVATVFVLAQMALGWAIMSYGSNKRGPATYSHGNNKLEFTWTGVTAAVFVVLAILGQRVWANLHFHEAPPDAIAIEVTAQQFAWNFRYAGPDGQFGETRANLVDDAGGNPLGVDPDDQAGKDDFWTTTLTIPKDKPVNLILRSKDVIHDFFVAPLRIKQDAVPGMKISLHFTANTTGKYEVACAELCGLGHYKMKSFMDVVSQEDFDKWLKEKAASR